jgi:glutamine synthetase
LDHFGKVKELLERESVRFVDLRACDLLGRWRHVTIPAAQFTEEAVERGVGFDGSNYGFAGVEQSDMVLIPDLGTARIDPLAGEPMLSLICDLYEADAGREPLRFDPRGTAKRAGSYLRGTGLADELRVAPEFEFYLFKESRVACSGRRIELCLEPCTEGGEDGTSAYHAMPPRDGLLELRNEISAHLEAQRLSVKYHHHEVGSAGQAEIELNFMGLVEAADAIMLVKDAVRRVALRHGLKATFMPKPLHGEAGSGLHLHQRLVRDGANCFADPEGHAGLSKLALGYIAGLLRHGASLMAFTNPSTNSYRRFVPGFEAPIEPRFAVADRSGAVRIPGYVRNQAERRIELRTMDATANPYLALAAILLAGLDGVREGLDPLREDFSAAPLPRSLEEALEALEADQAYLHLGGVFSEEQIAHWIRSKRAEAASVQQRPHPYEFLLYFDL